MSPNYIIVYGLAEHPLLKVVLPQAYIANTTKLGRARSIVAKALPDTVHSYLPKNFGPEDENLIDLCTELSEEHIVSLYAKKNRKLSSLPRILDDNKSKYSLGIFLNKKMNDFIAVGISHSIELFWNVERNIQLESRRIFINRECLRPIVAFEKLSDGLRYSLRLTAKKEVIRLHECNSFVVLDKPGYALIDYNLFRIDQLNGNKLKPFVSSPFIMVPERLTKTYFKKFIVDLVSKVEVEASGFDVISFDKIVNMSTKLSTNLFTGHLELILVIDYGVSTYQFNETNKRLSFLHMDESGNVTIHRVRRSEAEKIIAQKLVALGLVLTRNQCFKIDKSGDPCELVDWIIHHKNELLDIGIEVVVPEIDGKRIQLSKSSISLKAEAKQDWFDVEGEITVGKFIIKLVELKDHIKNENRFFELPNGYYFLIPQSWFNKFSALFQFGSIERNLIHIKKSHYTIMENIDQLTSAVQANLVDEIEYIPSKHLFARLRPYQEQGVKWLIAHQLNGLGACLADDMGLGKTMQTLAVLNYAKDRLQPNNEMPMMSGQLDLFYQATEKVNIPLRTLVILPTSLVFNWVNEIRQFSPRFRICIYIGPERKQKAAYIQEYDMVLTTYQTAQRDIDILSGCHWEYVILDESQMIKNKESKVFKAMNMLETKNKISLSGTPIENSLADLWSQMQFINPDMLGSYSFFKRTFQVPIERNQDEAALEQLRELVSPFILRRRKEEVARDLPELTRVIEYIPMKIQQAELFEREKSAVRNYLFELDEANPGYHVHVLSSLLKLRQIANHPLLIDKTYEGGSGKFEYICNKLTTIIKSGHKVLLFSSFTSHLDLFSDYLDIHNIKYCQLTGQTSQKQRKNQVERFQSDSSFQIFLISIKAGGTGLNLTAADHVFILDPWWNPFVEEQAIARAHRIGSLHPISVFRFISKDSIEEKIIRLQASKLMRSAEMIESQGQIKLTKKELGELLS
jgi:non-specific serine/threonine protein kinase